VAEESGGEDDCRAELAHPSADDHLELPLADGRFRAPVPS
jgi:hypothetical protein